MTTIAKDMESITSKQMQWFGSVQVSKYTPQREKRRTYLFTRSCLLNKQYRLDGQQFIAYKFYTITLQLIG